MSGKLRLFITSVQKEFAAERRALRDFVDGDALLRRFFSVFLFEDLPASDRRAGSVYLGEVDRCDIYIGLFGREWGAPKNGADSRKSSFGEGNTPKDPKWANAAPFIPLGIYRQ